MPYNRSLSPLSLVETIIRQETIKTNSSDSRQYNTLNTKRQELTLEVAMKGMLISGVVELQFVPISVAQGTKTWNKYIQLFYEV